MRNEHKVVTASASGFTVYYTDSQKHYNYEYDQPLLPYLKNIQLYGDSYKGKSYQSFDDLEFTSAQNRQYKDLVYGLNSYSLKQLHSLSTQEKAEIAKAHVITQKVLNKWKQQLCGTFIDRFLENTFPRSKQVKTLIGKSRGFTDNKIINTLNFSQLGLSKIDIAQKLINSGLLSESFFQAAA